MGTKKGLVFGKGNEVQHMGLRTVRELFAQLMGDKRRKSIHFSAATTSPSRNLVFQTRS